MPTNDNNTEEQNSRQDKRTERVSDRLSSETSPDPGDRFSVGGDTETEAQTDSEPSTREVRYEYDSDVWVGLQLYVPEALRTEFNDDGYFELKTVLRNRELDRADLDQRQMQRGAVRALIDNPELWADALEQLYGESTTRDDEVKQVE